MSSIRNKAAVKAYFDAWNKHDPEALVAAFTANSTFWDNTMSAPLPIAEARAGFESFLKAVPDLHFEVTQIVATEGEHAVAEWRMRGTVQAGKKFDIPGIDIFEIGEGKLRAARAYFNPGALPS